MQLPVSDSDRYAQLAPYGLTERMVEAFDERIEPGQLAGRVVRVDRGLTHVGSTQGHLWAQPFLDGAGLDDVEPDEAAIVAVGDWVIVSPRPGTEVHRLEAILPRRSAIDRVKAFSKTRQILVANMDTVFIVQAADNFNPRRLERELALVWASGAEPVAVLNKIDLCADVPGAISRARFLAGEAEVLALNGISGEGVSRLREFAGPGATVAFIGASGVGKSTLSNRLLGVESLATGAIRENDQRGRHATISRDLVPIPGGGVLIDTPGLRELGLTDDTAGIAQVFSDIEELAPECRFRDCRHGDEPGCAIRDALEEGELSEERLKSYRKLQREADRVEIRQDAGKWARHRNRKKAWARAHKQRERIRRKSGRGL